TGGGNYNLLMKNAKAEGVADKIQFKQADVRQLPFEAGSFDVIVSSGALHHIGCDMSDHEKALNEMTRVLKPGGKIVLWDTTHMVKGYASRMKAVGITSEVKEAVNSPFGFEMSVMTGQKNG
ncbi:MAG: class I SAM-dependent methyltransferase, partial [Chloroflexota bacterium]